jgi:hypothetical protein
VLGTIQIFSLSVYLEEICPKSFMEDVLANMSRICELHIRLNSEMDVEGILSHLVGATAPMPEILYIMIDAKHDVTNPNKWEDHSPHPLRLDAPAL